ncbi:YdaU family protein [Mesorhizobium sp. RP14(2022)]|uniref:YdaU family protein n=1 Tax=Mesorhizobium liriopis TaxID=2953882 RepID=A0ABT1C7J6_9HYPH|nr:DUF1376 domain-containing protein [Mesorhizobium liriopis]MCO6050638.1 YdaU family protein [Mesorhizobium liriopis]
MSAVARNVRAPGAIGSLASDVESKADGRGAGSLDAARAPAPWFRLHAARFLSQTSRLSPVEFTIYVRLLAHMHEDQGPLKEDHRRLATACHIFKTSSFKTALDSLVEQGLVTRSSGGLWADAAQMEEEFRRNRSELGRQKAAKRWEKNKEKQRPDDAEAYREREKSKREMTESERDVLNERHRSSDNSSSMSTGSSSTLDRSRDARPSAASPTTKQKFFREDDEVPIPSIGVCVVLEELGGNRYTVRHMDTGESYQILSAADGSIQFVDEDSEEDYDDVPF